MYTIIKNLDLFVGLNPSSVRVAGYRLKLRVILLLLNAKCKGSTGGDTSIRDFFAGSGFYSVSLHTWRPEPSQGGSGWDGEACHSERNEESGLLCVLNFRFTSTLHCIRAPCHDLRITKTRTDLRRWADVPLRSLPLLRMTAKARTWTVNGWTIRKDDHAG